MSLHDPSGHVHRHQTVAVHVQHERRPARQHNGAELGGDGKPTGKMMKEYLPLSPEMMSQVEGIVKSAIGYDSSRGDLVTVENDDPGFLRVTCVDQHAFGH